MIGGVMGALPAVTGMWGRNTTCKGRQSITAQAPFCQALSLMFAQVHTRTLHVCFPSVPSRRCAVRPLGGALLTHCARMEAGNESGGRNQLPELFTLTSVCRTSCALSPCASLKLHSVRTERGGRARLLSAHRWTLSEWNGYSCALKGD